MPKEIILDVTTGIVVLGSVFGVSHWRKLKARLRATLQSGEMRKTPQRAVPTASSSEDDVLILSPLRDDESPEQRQAG